MALVRMGCLNATDMKKFLENLVLSNSWSDFEINSSQRYSMDEPFQKLFSNSDPCETGPW